MPPTRVLLIFAATLAAMLVAAGDVLDIGLAEALRAARQDLPAPTSRAGDLLWLRLWTALGDAVDLAPRTVASTASAAFAAIAAALVAATRRDRGWTALLVAACPAVWLHSSSPGPTTFVLAGAAALDAALRSGRGTIPALVAAGLAMALEPLSVPALALVGFAATRSAAGPTVSGPRIGGLTTVAILLFVVGLCVSPPLRTAALDDFLRAFFPLSWFVLVGAIHRDTRRQLGWILLAAWPVLAQPEAREGAALIVLAIPLADATARLRPGWATTLVLVGLVAGVLRVGAHDLGPEARSWQTGLARSVEEPTRAAILTHGDREFRLLTVAAPRAQLLRLDDLLELCASFDDHLPTAPSLDQALDVWVEDLRTKGHTLVLTRTAEERLRDRGVRVRHRQASRLLDELQARFTLRAVIEGAFDAKVLTPR